MIVTRFAPSPTGYLHIGGLRTALYSFLWARRNGGKFLLRIEDTDLARNSKEAAEAIIEAFKWVGLTHDGDILYQSERFDIYKSYVQKLLDTGKAYKCYMSKEELDALRAEQMAKKERTRYDGRYRDFTGTPPLGVEPVIRIKAPLDGQISFVDGVKGEVSFNAKDMLDDFIIARSDGTPTYNFVVSIDDALMGVTEVIRGDDHLSNTPKQIVVYEALGFEVPRFHHVPMILNPEGKKLSKRDGATDVMDYKKEGYLAETLLNFLIRLGWSHGDQEIFSLQEMQAWFDPNDINKSASAYNKEKLLWLNTHYIKTLPADRLIEELKFFDVDIHLHVKKIELIDALRERAKTLKEFAIMVNQIIHAPSSYDEGAVSKFLGGEAIAILQKYLSALEQQGVMEEAETFEQFTKAFLESNGLKLKDLAQSIRIAMVGSAVSPSIFEILAIIGYEEVKQRIQKLISSKRSMRE